MMTAANPAYAFPSSTLQPSRSSFWPGLLRPRADQAQASKHSKRAERALERQILRAARRGQALSLGSVDRPYRPEVGTAIWDAGPLRKLLSLPPVALRLVLACDDLASPSARPGNTSVSSLEAQSGLECLAGVDQRQPVELILVCTSQNPEHTEAALELAARAADYGLSATLAMSVEESQAVSRPAGQPGASKASGSFSSDAAQLRSTLLAAREARASDVVELSWLQGDRVQESPAPLHTLLRQLRLELGFPNQAAHRG